MFRFFEPFAHARALRVAARVLFEPGDPDPRLGVCVVHPAQLRDEILDVRHGLLAVHLGEHDRPLVENQLDACHASTIIDRTRGRD